jgi:hypothetical protein
MVEGRRKSLEEGRRKLLGGRARRQQFHAIAAAPRLIPLCMRVR